MEVKAKPLTDADIQLIRQDVQGQKNQIITDTMKFTESEAAAFWPVYKEFASAQQATAAKRWNLIVDYAQNIDKMDDQKAKDLSQRMFAIDDEIQGLRKSKCRIASVIPVESKYFFAVKPVFAVYANF